MKSDQIRHSFLEFFSDRGHHVVASAPLIPPDDPTLLFTTAGMVQFKPLYPGHGELPYSRACSVQKCLRAGGKGSDLENVGRTIRHHTFFEMLGNFSFGDYFKRDALMWAWEFSTKVVKLDPERIYASVYEDDDEAWDIWTKEIGLPEERMVRLGVKDNFWGPAGDTGACGPCSELYYDRGQKYGADLTFQHATINDDDPGSRFLEFWNCVFPQFDQQKDGSRPLLKNRGVDTGMSLERLCCLVQESDSLYTTDLMRPLVDRAAELMGVPSYDNATVEIQQAVNVVVDHVRALTFVISEGILPGNEGRGYVMRRLLRRAARYARKAGQEQPFMEGLVDPIISLMGTAYPEIRQSPDHVKKVIRTEEHAYVQTLGAGLARLDDLLHRSAGGTPQLSGSDVFQLTATYGLPFDDILEIAEERGFSIDMESYRRHISEHQSLSRQGGKGSRLGDIADELKRIAESAGATAFLGYPEQNGPSTMEMLQDMLTGGEEEKPFSDFPFDDSDELEATDGTANIEDIFQTKSFQDISKGMNDIFGPHGTEFDDDDEDDIIGFDSMDDDDEEFDHESMLEALEDDDFFSGAYPVATVPSLLIGAIFKDGQLVESATTGDDVAIVVDQTPFYAESGGQVADTGWMTEGNVRVRIYDVQKSPEDIYVHFGTVENGTLTKDCILDAGIDVERRMDIMRNHTATHLLQGALKRVLGQHVAQQGSLVGPDYLRFDFTNPEAVSQAQLQEIERLVNEQIMADHVLNVSWMSREEARQLPGIIAPFGEKYGQRVRVVDVPQWDTEFCGGTHLLATGEAGLFIITSESAVSSGVRRIEATTGRAALEIIQAERTALKSLSEDLKVPRGKILERVETLQHEIKQLRREMAALQAAASSADAAGVLDSAEEIAGVKVIVHQFKDLDAKALREAYDAIKSRRPEGMFALLASVRDGKATLIAGASKDVTARGLSAGDVIRTAAQAAGGSGGGKPEMAQAGVKDASKLPEALKAGSEAAKARLGAAQ
jgi:alanyl-tRNA synthetase